MPFFLKGSKRKLYSSRERTGTLTMLLPSLVMIDSLEMISPSWPLIASRTFSWWRAWSFGPFRCRLQSLWLIDIGVLMDGLLYGYSPRRHGEHGGCLGEYEGRAMSSMLQSHHSPC